MREQILTDEKGIAYTFLKLGMDIGTPEDFLHRQILYMVWYSSHSASCAT